MIRRCLALAFFAGACSHAPAAEHEHGHGHPHPHPHADASDTGAGFSHRFDDPKKWAAVFDAPERDAWQMPAEVVEKCEIAAGQVVADIGAGTGYFLPHLSRAVGTDGRVLALDVERTLIAHMISRIEKEGLGNTTAKLVRPDDPGLEANSVDRILIVDTWHHIGNRVAYGRKLKAGLREGGRVIVVDFTMDSPEGPPKAHRLAPSKVVEELKAAGFEASTIETKLPRQYIVVGE